MLIIRCHICGVFADETELQPGGEAHIKRYRSQSSTEDFSSYLFDRSNKKGIHFERWRHAYGCGKWFHVARCTETLEVFGSYSAQTLKPPKSILDKIKVIRPDFKGWKNE